ncbi:MAG: protein-L-isoaspartate(D-aspartate) O-methyltransferase [bacterium]|nr:protein-L-isoaspartate(D-aspartate) O-methyltransferase [bacterium]
MNRTRRAPGTLCVLLAVAALFAVVSIAEPEAPDETADARQRMVRDQIESRGVEDARVLAAMSKVPRHELVPAEMRPHAYSDRPLPIGLRQTISQPYIVAYMTEQLKLEAGDRVLEVGTGSGYQAAVLAQMGAEVWSIEIVPELAQRAARDLARIGYDEVHVREGDGYRGWPEHAPFDAIIITAAPPRVPQPLVEQLAVGGRMVLPVGENYQELVLIERTEKGVERSRLIPVRFVPMTGEVRRGGE